MRIATVTFHRALNYGAVLQTFALQHTLDNLGHDSEVLNYHSEFIEKHYQPAKARDYLTPKKLAILLLLNGYSIVKREQFQPFVDRYIKVTQEVYDNETIQKAEGLFDLFIAGSDQIWNYKTAGFDKNYFLEFIENNDKKCSYAASLGVEVLPSAMEREYVRLLSSFRRIAVREDAANHLLSHLLERNDICTTLDPTLLVDAGAWEKMQEPVVVPNKYVLLYLLYQDRKMIRFAQRLAKRKNCKVLYINNQLMKQPGVVNLRGITPQQWLYLFRHADYVVTNSFHGTVFSIIFEKVFWTDYLPQSNSVNSRIVSLLNSLQLMYRIISEGCSLERDEVDYGVSEELLSRQIKASVDYLKELR